MYILVFGFIILTVKNCFFINTVSCLYFCRNSYNLISHTQIITNAR